MLVLSRKSGESIVIDGRIVVRIIRVEGEVVKVGIEAPNDVPIFRQEIYQEIQQNNLEARSSTGHAIPKLPAINQPVRRTQSNFSKAIPMVCAKPSAH